MSDIKTNLSTALWRDLKTDSERAAWLLLGRGFETGVVCKSIQNDLAMSYGRLIEYKNADTALGEAADAFIVAWDSLTSVDLALAEPFVEALRQALAEPDMGIDRGAWADVPNATKWVDELRGDDEPESTQSQELFGKTEEEPYNGWILRNVYFEDGEPLMHSEPESTQSQELFGKTDKLESESKRLQEREWVDLTDEEILAITFDAKITEPNDEPIKFGAPSRKCIKDLVSGVEAKLKEKNCG